MCGIATQHDQVVIYPEWIHINTVLNTKMWTVQQVLFKGFYEDIIIRHNDVLLRVLNNEAGKYSAGDQLSISVKKWLQY